MTKIHYQWFRFSAFILSTIGFKKGASFVETETGETGYVYGFEGFSSIDGSFSFKINLKYSNRRRESVGFCEFFEKYKLA